MRDVFSGNIDKISTARKEQIAANFARSIGILSKEDEKNLESLPVREIFQILCSQWKFEDVSTVLQSLRHFPREETVELLEELRADKQGAQNHNKQTIHYLLQKFLHHPETARKAALILKESKDPKAIFESKKGTIEIAEPSMIEEMEALDPTMRQNKEWLKKSVKEGAVFVLRNQKNHINSFAIAHQMASYVLYIDYVFTDPNNRQQGYGEEMIRYLIKEHAIIEAHLLRGDLLSKKVLQKLGFKKEAQGNVWVYKNPQASNWKFI